MGQTLSEPMVEKKSDDGQDNRVAYGVSAMQGWRISMEDAHTAVLDLQVEDPQKSFQAASTEDRLSYFGVYDGHGGEKVAIYTGENLHKILANQEAFRKGDFEQALQDAFLATDRALLNDPKFEDEVSGCTAAVGLISKTKIYVANAGDSRSVLGVKGRAKPLSFDHKPVNEGEKARIVAAGGFVELGRVNGNLALSRAIGDFEFKKGATLSPQQQIVTAFPDVIAHPISNDDEFLVIACDGIWDCQSSQSVIEFVRRGIAARQPLSKICENMMDNCLASSSETGGVGCDNMTMIVIALLKGKSTDEWYKEIGDRVSNGDGPCAPPEYADFRGPGMRYHGDVDSGDDSDQLTEPYRGGFGARSARIILLGDGTEILTDSNDMDMFDHEEEDKDLESQVSKGRNPAKGDQDDVRGGREETPGPQVPPSREKQQSSDGAGTINPSDPLSSTNSDTSTPSEVDRAKSKQITPAALPEKLVTSAESSETGRVSPRPISVAALSDDLLASSKPSEAGSVSPEQSPAAALPEKLVASPKPA